MHNHGMATTPPKPLYRDDPCEFDLREYDLLQTSGWNRSRSEPTIHAENDADAVHEFIDSLCESPPTTRVLYAKELERLLLWCLHVAGTTITELRETELRRYRRFLQKPYKRWCDPDGRKPQRLKRDGNVNPDWRPFAGPLGETSVAKAERCLSSFFGFLVKKRYADVNPMPKTKRTYTPRFRDRHLPVETLGAALTALEALQREAKTEAQTNALARATFLLQVYFYLGLRISEVAKHRMTHFVKDKNNDEELWFFRVTGKGDKERFIPVPDEFLDALVAFRRRLGANTPLPSSTEKIALVPKLDAAGQFIPKEQVAARRLSNLVEDALGKAADWLESSSHTRNREHVDRLKLASSHWLRHTYGTTMVDNGMPLTDVRDNLGHASVITTEIYLHDDQRERHWRSRSHGLRKERQ